MLFSAKPRLKIGYLGRYSIGKQKSRSRKNQINYDKISDIEMKENNPTKAKENNCMQ